MDFEDTLRWAESQPLKSTPAPVDAEPVQPPAEEMGLIDRIKSTLYAWKWLIAVVVLLIIIIIAYYFFFSEVQALLIDANAVMDIATDRKLYVELAPV